MQYPTLVQTKTSQNRVAYIEWNPGMDLLATVFCNGALTCSRLLSLQKVWHIQPEGTIEGIAWRPDGRVLAVGAYNSKTKDYKCTLHDVENGQEINTIHVGKPITSVSWFQLKDDKEKEEKHKKQTLSSTTKDCSETFSHQLAHNQSQLNVLMISTDDGKISFYALGLFYLGDMSVTDAYESMRIYKTHSSGCFKYITALMQTKNNTTKASDMLIFNLDTFHDRSSEILEVAKMYARITDELDYLNDTMNAITTSWADVLAGLDSKLSSYCSRKIGKPDDSESGYTFINSDELLQLLVTGFTSDGLEKFLADMTDKGLKKLNIAIEQTCLRVQNLIVKNAQKCCYHLHGDLNALRALAVDSDKNYEEVGLDDKFIVEAMRSVGALMLKLTELQQVIDHSLKSSKAFFRWLISIACRMTNEQNNSMIPNDTNKTTQQDIQLITDFILENFDCYQDEFETNPRLAATSKNDASDSMMNRPTCSNFTLEQIGQYLKDEPLSRLKYSFSKPGANFWIEFFKARPELTQARISEKDGSSILLFYPHNQETSLIQEYKQTRQSIQSTFESVASNMIKLLSKRRHVLQSYTILNTPASRVKVHTDLGDMNHYVLYQLETNIEQSLAWRSLAHKGGEVHDNIIGIQFKVTGQRASRSQAAGSRNKLSAPYFYHLVIADADFYENKEDKQILLTFLLVDTYTNDTAIVQIDLDRVLYEPVASAHNKNTCKTLESKARKYRHKERLLFYVDLHKEPPKERDHSPDLLVVKRIKKTVGQDMFLSSGRGVIAFTSCSNKRLHLYELESLPDGSEILDDEAECDERLDESLIDTDLVV